MMQGLGYTQSEIGKAMFPRPLGRTTIQRESGKKEGIRSLVPNPREDGRIFHMPVNLVEIFTDMLIGDAEGMLDRTLIRRMQIHLNRRLRQYDEIEDDERGFTW